MSDRVLPCIVQTPHAVYGSYHYLQYQHEYLSQVLTTTQPPVQDLQSPDAFLGALVAGHTEVVAEALRQGTHSVNAPLPSGLVPLHYAAARGHHALVQLLLDVGALIDLPDKQHETALYKACFGGHAAVVSTLLGRGANVQHTDKDGWSCLHNASAKGALDVASLLLDYGAAVDVVGGNGLTPLMLAASKGHLGMVQFLIARGADPLVKNDTGDTAYDLAAQAEQLYISELLLRAENDAVVDGPENERTGFDETHNTFVEVLHCNQRWSLLSSTFSGEHLTVDDGRGEWSTAEGKALKRDDVDLPETANWFWLTDWKVDTSHPLVNGQDGWQYARSFGEAASQWSPQAPTGILTLATQGLVRRQRWYRVRRRVTNVGEHKGTVRPSPSTTDYMKRALDIIAPVFDDAETLSHAKAVSLYERALQILLSGISTDKDSQHKKKASALVTEYLAAMERLMGKGHDRDGLLSETQPIDVPVAGAMETHESSFSSLPMSSENAHLPHWQPDEEALVCNGCGRPFSLWLRRHHCRRCGLIFCTKCSEHKTILPDFPPNSPQRVCAACMFGGGAKHNIHTNNRLRQPQAILAPDTASIDSSMMTECPVCQLSLHPNIMTQEQREAHVADCFSKGKQGDLGKGRRYIVQKLTEGNGKECIICFEEFESGTLK